MKLASPSTLLLGCLLLSSSVTAMSNAPAPAPKPADELPVNDSTVNNANSNNDFKLLTYNVYMLPRAISDWSPDARAQHLLSSDIFNDYDAIILDELFDNQAGTTLLNGLKQAYPNQTPVLGRSQSGWDATEGNYGSTTIEDGGVSIISPWPITEKVQYIYSSACGFDGTSNKGFVYVKLNKNGRDFHVIGTHVQAEDSLCSTGQAAQIRLGQFQEIQQFIEDRNINTEDLVFIGGDLNVNKGTQEYQNMLEALQVNEPHYSGYDATWDPKSNGIAHYNYPDLHSEYLDYIFVSRNHAQPAVWQNQAIDITGPRWEDDNYQFQELSDHYPVAAFTYADENTRTQSERAVNTPFSQLTLRNKGNNKLIKVNPNNATDWMTINGTAVNSETQFNISNWHPKNAFCLRSGDWVQIESNRHQNHYWNWWLGGGNGNFAYYPKSGDATNKLRLLIQNDHGGCLKSGDEVVFMDRDTRSGSDYYLTRWASGSWTDYLFMWSSSIGANETFVVDGVKAPQYEQYGSKLIYAPAQ